MATGGMMRKRSRRAGLLTVGPLATAVLVGGVLLSGGAAADELQQLGTIEASIDGSQGRWETLAVPAEGAATANYRITGATTSIAIQGHDPDAEHMRQNVLNLEVRLVGEEADAEILGAGVNLFPDGLENPFYVSDAEGAGASVTFEHLDLGAEEGVAAGRFTATICRRESIKAEADPDACREVEGRFDTELRVLKD
ncbi:hypothetical protein ACFOW6_15810 [Fodinicurvata halophila]|uniref:Uncharacterized protein n=1 Tax=Fodinicurvata halophila TaxID=1419723 RepID=A0ABV8UP15_9PROT